MQRLARHSLRRLAVAGFALVLVLAAALPVTAEGYAALQGVQRLDTVFDVSLDDPGRALGVFPAIRGVYRDRAVRGLSAPPRTVIVFHGPAVHLVSSDRSGLSDDKRAAFAKVADWIRQFRKDGVKLEICMYAVRTLGVDPATIMSEVDKVGNGFIAVAGYQARGYSLIAVP